MSYSNHKLKFTNLITAGIFILLAFSLILLLNILLN
jgi:hypothetical protein